MQTVHKMLILLTNHERKRAVLLFFMVLIMAFLDMIGVASILPFMAVLTNPSLVETNMILNSMYQASIVFGVENNQQFLFALGVLVLALLIISLTFKALTTYVQAKFLQVCEYGISKRLVEGYLNQPYKWFLNRNSAELGKSILSLVSIVCGDSLRPLIDLISKSLIALALITMLIIADPKLSLIVGFTLSTVYGIIFYFARQYLSRLGKKNLDNNEFRFMAVSEAFGAAKEIKVGGLEHAYIKTFQCRKNLFSNSS